MDPGMDISFLNKYDKLIMELGCGDGRLLYGLANKDMRSNAFYLGIELDVSQFKKCCCLLLSSKKENLFFVNCSLEDAINELPDYTVDEILSILPHPKYIDRENENYWKPIYRTILCKIKRKGHLLLVTEFTDRLFSPVAYEEYKNWKEWIIATFTGLGYCVGNIIEGAPVNYSSQFLDLFSNDKQRIKILTLYLSKN
jgi:hypothetical protein